MVGRLFLSLLMLVFVIGAALAVSTGCLMLETGVDFLLLEDGVSKLLLEGATACGGSSSFPSRMLMGVGS